MSNMRANVQIFTATGAGTWVKPFGCRYVRVVCIGAGGGGGGGANNTGGVVRAGGAGGGGGALATKDYSADDLGSTETVYVGIGGTLGTGATNAPAAATSGGNGENSYFGTTAANRLIGYGGGGGRLGNNTGGGGGGGGGTGGSNSSSGGVGGDENVIGAGPAPLDEPHVSGACSMQRTTEESSSLWMALVGLFVLAKRRKTNGKTNVRA